VFGAILLFIISVLEFARLDITHTKIIMTVYYILFGVLIILFELKLTRVLDQFHFMRFALGKCLWCFFLTGLLFSIDYWLQIVVFIFFAVAGVFYGIIGIIFRNEEREIHEKYKPQDDYNQRGQI